MALHYVYIYSPAYIAVTSSTWFLFIYTLLHVLANMLIVLNTLDQWSHLYINDIIINITIYVYTYVIVR